MQDGDGDSAPMGPGLGQGGHKVRGLTLARGVFQEEPHRVLEPWKWTSKGTKACGAGWPPAIDREAH